MRRITEEEFSKKYDLYKPMLYSIAYSYLKNTSDADDIVQDTFMKYLGTYKNFDTLDSEKYFLIRVCINIAINLLKSKWKRDVIKDDSITDVIYSSDDSSNVDYFSFICSLPLKYKSVMVLYYWENFSVEEVAKALNISTSSVKKRLERGRNMIKDKIENMEDSNED